MIFQIGFEIVNLKLKIEPEVPLPITKSAKKSYRVSETKRKANLLWEKKLKMALKKVDQKNANEVISIIDKTAKHNIISPNRAARLKSRITKKFGSPKKTVKAKVDTPQKTVKKVVSKPKTKKK